MCKGLIRCLSKTIVRLVLCVLLIIGLALAVAGGIIVDGRILLKYIPTDTIKKEIEEAVEPLVGEYGEFPKEYTEFNQGDVNNIVYALKPLGRLLYIWGLVQTIWSLTGLIAGCGKLGLGWSIYVVCCGSVATIFFFMTVMIDDVPKNLVERLLPEYGGLPSKDLWSIAFTGLMFHYECCGVRNFKDFKDLENWPPKLTKEQFDRFLPNVKYGENVPLQNPNLPKPKTRSLPVINRRTPVNREELAKKHGLDKDALNDIPEEILKNPNLLNLVTGRAEPKFKTPIACCKDIASGIKTGCFLEGVAFEINNNMNKGCLREVMGDWRKYGRFYLWALLMGLGAVHALMAVLGILIFATTDPNEEEI